MNLPISAALAQALFQFLWQGALVALALAAAIHLFRLSSARLRYALACLALLAMLISFGATLAWYWPHSASVTAHSNAARAAFPAPPLWLGYEARALSQSPKAIDWIAPVWLLGVAGLSLRSMIAWAAAALLKRRGVVLASIEWQARLKQLVGRIRVSRSVILLESYLTDVPIVVGYLKPVILIPAQLLTGLPPDQIEFILIHELAHIRRHDYFVNLLQTFAEDVLFYHPAVWWVSSVIRAERENCCDDVVAEHGDAHSFAEALAALEQHRWAAHEAALAANGGHLMHRIERLLNRGGRPRLASAAFFASLLPVAFVAATAIAHAQSAETIPALPVPPAPRPPELIAQAAPAPASTPEPAPATTVPDPYKKWLNQDVVYIITPEERRAFANLATDEERQHFIEQFWLRRDPTPDTQPNEYREEFYRRIAYADQNFAAGDIPGWKTDRGMIYIKYGPPDEREEHPNGGVYNRPIEEGGGQTTTFPFDKWLYRYIQGIGKDVTIEFVDPSQKGEYHMTIDPTRKDALLNVPGGCDPAAKGVYNGTNKTFYLCQGPAQGTTALPTNTDQFRRLEQFSQLQKPPQPPVPAQDAIEDIVFKGARRIPQDVLRAVIRTQAGDKYDKDALDRDTARLWSTQAFSDVSWNFARGKTGWIITFTVVEKIIERP